jgi:hypothetical protein
MKNTHNIKNENVYDIINNIAISKKKKSNIGTIHSNDSYSVSNDVFHIDTS